MKTIFLLLLIISLSLSSYILEPKMPKDELISTPCAIFIMPTVEMIENLQKTDQDNYDAVLNDNMYYLDLTREFLDPLGISILDKEAEGKVNFKTTEDKIFEIDLSQNAWQVILFNGKDEPIKLNITDSEMQIKNYMK